MHKVLVEPFSRPSFAPCFLSLPTMNYLIKGKTIIKNWEQQSFVKHDAGKICDLHVSSTCETTARLKSRLYPYFSLAYKFYIWKSHELEKPEISWKIWPQKCQKIIFIRSKNSSTLFVFIAKKFPQIGQTRQHTVIMHFIVPNWHIYTH